MFGCIYQLWDWWVV